MKLLGLSRKPEKQVEPVTDLDQILAEPVPFRFKGRIHYLKPVALDEFLKFTNAQMKMVEFLKSEDSGPQTAEDLAKKYHAVISSVCDTIKVKDILSMSQAQVAALFQLVVDRIAGQVDLGDGEKKKPRMRVPIYDTKQPSSSPSVLPDSAG